MLIVNGDADPVARLGPRLLASLASATHVTLLGVDHFGLPHSRTSSGTPSISCRSLDMKLASFLAGGREAIGFEVRRRSSSSMLADAPRFAGSSAASPPTNMLSLIRAGSSALASSCAPRTPGHSNHAVTARPTAPKKSAWRAPVRSPSKVVCLALNNRALDKIKIRAPTDHPAFFLKPCTALTGHLCPIRLRAAFGLTHPEPELGVVIAQTLKDVSPAAALDGVFGYTIVNDITSVGMREEDSFSVRYFKPGDTPGAVTVGEAHTTYPGRYKASDTFAPMGPWIVTRDEIPDPAALKIECRLGERLVASDHTRITCGASPRRSRTSRGR